VTGRRQYVAAIDQGTTSSRCMVFDRSGRIIASEQREHRQILPRPGWVEHDATQILENVRAVVAAALAKADMTAARIAAFGITNQRETVVLWERDTGRPVHNAIVWQDTRTEQLCQEIGGEQGQDRFRARTGLPLSAYFSGSKVTWLLEHVPGLRERAERGEILFGTMDSWLIWNLTGGVHITDVTNASRTMLMDLRTLDWDDTLLAAFGVPRVMLPQIRPSAQDYGRGTGASASAPGADVLGGAPIAAALGDQQSALFGQTCFGPGEAKSTYGTGSFLLLNTGPEPVVSANGLLTTVGYQIGADPAVYALEGSIAVTGSLVQWLRDQLGLISSADEIEQLAGSVPDNGGVYLVPAFSGLFAPHWRGEARGVLAGLTRFATRAHLARAVLEATSWQTREVLDAMVKDAGLRLSTLRVDGGMTANQLLMQHLADVLDVPVVRPTVTETTCLGAAYAAGLAVGYWSDLDDLRANWRPDVTWTPAMDPSVRDHEYRMWNKTVQRTMNWLDE
jgi:glycerol kinase